MVPNYFNKLDLASPALKVPTFEARFPVQSPGTRQSLSKRQTELFGTKSEYVLV